MSSYDRRSDHPGGPSSFALAQPALSHASCNTDRTPSSRSVSVHSSKWCVKRPRLGSTTCFHRAGVSRRPSPIDRTSGAPRPRRTVRGIHTQAKDARRTKAIWLLPNRMRQDPVWSSKSRTASSTRLDSPAPRRKARAAPRASESGCTTANLHGRSARFLDSSATPDSGRLPSQPQPEWANASKCLG